MKIRLISIGRTEDDYIRIGAEHFIRQLRVYNPLEEIRIKGVKAGVREDVSKSLDLEGEKILKRLNPRDRVILLDRLGKGMTSEAFACFLDEALKAPVRSVSFVIGSAEGVSGSIRKRSDGILSLSKMTLTHELTRLLLLEQIYRGFTILRGKRYHR
ncbi:MAG: 23S rRNA (pseudouridine(1915)-N(3))-methyltransferase RlmH [Nitrospirae bacterium CG_4_9_14_3_um_filter_53_35]|nr:MAG: hypothetical protein AUK29_07910 [Nitrospirae bacterium CG2_30_53_67]PIS38303.1 MAG: 23S rRNA (pseudouridine(1915)-N(3))-methyltransferase RlmH [Nitrospirae bacterium CG08_land_8_20_14_0_20_52_24]PIV85329.1 MAG: 23S rRNA (pseudouridine(1915)-N(3))-methyltransferase RlmH [Nitrospirae bacterium CG17_big_fil_post_rev_8_21_14_2_50_50_9]PIW84841.1 MAG: 23S rRNA (pseudouridine(1915)-N(3))-methyltransferase RlmH [Nitrospirae bacterium CG_4_8_14_3_um_filter_50_41]PIX85613.1 MAG: 23S rRNA (pseud